VCDVNVAVLVSALTDVGAADCTGSADSDATVTRADGGRGPIRQRGLVNVNVTDLVVQVPVGIAANICDVNAGVLVGLLTDVVPPTVRPQAQQEPSRADVPARAVVGQRRPPPPVSARA